MLHKMKNGEIIKGLPELAALLPSSVHTKQKLLQMAANGEQKPRHKTLLNRRLYEYTRKSSSCYDEKFDAEIRKIRPEWLLSPTEKNKQQLLDMAKKKKPKPSYKTKIGAAFCRYITKSKGKYGIHYDQKFELQIKKIAPQWFVSPADKKKQLLLNMAGKGESRPHRITKIGWSLCSYTSKTSKAYDATFDKRIRKLRPDWFVPTSEKANQKKLTILEMAANGEQKPHHKTLLGKAFRSYSRKTSLCYDPIFEGKIKKIAPDWFLTGPERNKRRLLEMAKRKEPRPKRKTMFILYHYIRKASPCYDPVFAKKIRKLAPHWFKKKAL